ncbi:hypothetical protein BCEN4_740169 [Burkholderia cenocepacia]|nr:hypothetical protein BCEN4_740169 [Burkholderia cenocepacia]
MRPCKVPINTLISLQRTTELIQIHSKLKHFKKQTNTQTAKLHHYAMISMSLEVKSTAYPNA